MAKLPEYDKLVKAYPNLPLAEVKALIGARVDADWVDNACTLRVSRALNYSDAKVPFIKDAEGKQQTLKGADGLWYIFRVRILRKYLTDTYGAANIVAAGTTEAGVKTDPFLHARGIIGMKVSGWTNATGHFTLWDGAACVDGTNYLPQASEAWLWKGA